MSAQHPELDVPPLREVRAIVREDNGADHHYTFQSKATKESALILEVLIWFEARWGTARANDAQVIITNRHELNLR